MMDRRERNAGDEKVLSLRASKVQNTFRKLKSAKHTAGDSAVDRTIVFVLESQPLLLRY